MKKRIIFLFMLAVTSLTVAAQPAKPELKFGKNGYLSRFVRGGE
jgi:hypothetical protein